MLACLAVGAFLAPPTWTLVAGGDVMLNAVRPSPKTFAGIAPLVMEADLAYANLEIPLTRSTSRTRRKSAAEVKARTQFILKADPAHAVPLAAAGFDFLSLGNNHAMDYGQAGLEEMFEALDPFELALTGAGKNLSEAERVAVKTLPGGYRVGMISYLSFLTAGAMSKCDPAGPGDPGVATLTVGGASGKKERATVRAIVQRAKASCDFLIVALHWGQERQPQPRAYQVSLGRLFVDEGADAVFGAHPHVLQPGELYRGKPIIYSLGNLISPLGGSTALYRLTFDGKTLQRTEAHPAAIQNGRVSLAKQSDSALRVQEAAFRKLFPHRQSQPLLSPPTSSRGAK